MRSIIRIRGEILERTLTTTAIVFLLVIVSGLGSLGWVKWWYALAERDQQWEETLKKNNVEWEKLLSEETAKVFKADVALEEELAKQARERKRHDEELEKQRALAPISDACDRCRVPWERLFVRDFGKPISGKSK